MAGDGAFRCGLGTKALQQCASSRGPCTSRADAEARNPLRAADGPDDRRRRRAAARPAIGRRVVDAVLWTAGTVIGLAAAVAVPYLMITRHELEPGSAWRCLADAGRAADGLGRDGRRCSSHAARRRGAAGPAAGLLRDVRDQPARRVRRDPRCWGRLVHHGVGPAAAGADAVDRARPARPVGHGRQPAGERRRRPADPYGRARVRPALRRAGPGLRAALDGASRPRSRMRTGAATACPSA